MCVGGVDARLRGCAHKGQKAISGSLLRDYLLCLGSVSDRVSNWPEMSPGWADWTANPNTGVPTVLCLRFNFSV